MRTVPCMAGCEGPRFRCIGSAGSSSSFSSRSRSMGSMSVLSVRCRAREVLTPERHAFVGSERREFFERLPRLAFGAVRDERLRLVRGVILEKRMSFELGVHEDATKIRVALESH